MKSFYREVTVVDGAILLDSRPVKTPARASLTLPSSALADAVAGEWRAQGDRIDPRTMPLTGMSNAAIDRISPDPAGFARPLAAYAGSDLLCYRADAPADLVQRQAEIWDPLLAWAQGQYDVHFTVATGIVHAAQPAATVTRLEEAVLARTPFELAALSPIVTIGGSLIVGLALVENAIDADRAFAATHLDEMWQAERWGEDALALAAREARRQDFMAAVVLLRLL